MGIISWIRKSFCVPHVFQVDLKRSPNSRRNVAPILFRNVGSPYLRHENFDESIEMFLLKSCQDQEAIFANKMTQTEESYDNNCEIGYNNNCNLETSSAIPLASFAMNIHETKNEGSADLYQQFIIENIYIDDDYHLEGEQEYPSNLLLFSSVSEETTVFNFDETIITNNMSKSYINRK